MADPLLKGVLLETGIEDVTSPTMHGVLLETDVDDAASPKMHGVLLETDIEENPETMLFGVQAENDAFPGYATLLFGLWIETYPTSSAPPQVVDFTASDGVVNKVTMAWTNPNAGGLARVIVRRKVGSYPTDHTDGTLVYDNLSPTPGAPVVADDLTAVIGTTYYYAVFGLVGISWQDLVTAGLNADTGVAIAPPAPPLVGDFQASDLEIGKVVMTWTNPVSALLAEVVVRRKIGSYPTDHTDGDLVYQNLAPVSGAAVSADDLTAVIGQLYYYAVFGANAGPVWNETVTPGSNADTGRAISVTPGDSHSDLGVEKLDRFAVAPNRMDSFSGNANDSWSGVMLFSGTTMKMMLWAGLKDLEVSLRFSDGTDSAAFTVKKGQWRHVLVRCDGIRVRNKVAGEIAAYQALGFYQS